MSRDRRCGHHAAETQLHACTAARVPRYHSVRKVKKVFIVIVIPKPSFNSRTGWSVGEHAFAWSSKQTLPRLARSTLNELQQNQHEKASLVCVRVQSPSGLALVPCALSTVDVSVQLRCWITHTNMPGTEQCLIFIFGTLCSYDPLWRGFLFPWKTKGKKARFARLPHYNIPE